MTFFRDKVSGDPGIVNKAVDLENWGIPLKLLWKILVFSFMAIGVYFTVRTTIDDLQREVAALRAQVVVMNERLQEQHKEVKLIRSTQAAALKEIAEHTGLRYFICPVESSIWEIAYSLHLSSEEGADELMRLNPHVQDFSRVPVGTLIRVPRSIRIPTAVTTAPPQENAGP